MLLNDLQRNLLTVFKGDTITALVMFDNEDVDDEGKPFFDYISEITFSCPTLKIENKKLLKGKSYFVLAFSSGETEQMAPLTGYYNLVATFIDGTKQTLLNEGIIKIKSRKLLNHEHGDDEESNKYGCRDQKYELHFNCNKLHYDIKNPILLTKGEHQALANLDYASSGHIGFASSEELYRDYANNFKIEQDKQTGIVTITLFNKSGEILAAKSIDLDTERIIEAIKMDFKNKRLVFLLVSGQEIYCDISDMIDTLTSLINTTAEKIAAEETRAMAAENELHEALEAEVQNRISEDERVLQEAKAYADITNVNVQSDWVQEDFTQDDYIKNKPEIASLKEVKDYLDVE